MIHPETRAALIGALIGAVLAFFASFYFVHRSEDGQRVDTTVRFLLQFSDSSLTEAKNYIDSLGKMQPTNKMELYDQLRPVRPLQSYLEAFSACVTSNACDLHLSKSLLCSNIVVFEETIVRLYSIIDERRPDARDYYVKMLEKCK